MVLRVCVSCAQAHILETVPEVSNNQPTNNNMSILQISLRLSDPFLVVTLGQQSGPPADENQGVDGLDVRGLRNETLKRMNGSV